MDQSTLGPVAIMQVIVVYVIQKLKAAQWFAWLDENSATANRVVAYLIAFASAAGITWQWQGAQGQLIVNGLVWSTIVQGLYTSAVGLITNELTYLMLQIKQQTTSVGRQVGASPVVRPAKPPE